MLLIRLAMQIPLIKSLYLACLMAAPLAAQTTYFSEDFTAGVPPTGWFHQKVSGSMGWHSSGSTRAWHEDESGYTCDSYLVSPVIDLSSASSAYLHFAGETYYVTYLANHPNGFGDGISNVEVTTDGGATWTVLWTDTSTVDNTPYAPNLNLTPYAGNSNVQIAFHYYGTYAHEWWVDYLIVDDVPVPTLAQAVNPNNGHPYALLGASDIGTAQAMASAMGGHLVTISDLSENTWIQNNFANTSSVTADLWLGYSDATVEGVFEWINGEVTGYENWAAGEPNNSGNEDYVQMNRTTGQWNDVNNTVMGHAIIEISEPRLDVTTPLIAGQLTTFSTTSFPSGSNIVYIVSTIGAGPSNTPYGQVEVDLDIISPLFYDRNSGSHLISTRVPLNFSGRTLYAQAIVFEPDNDVTISNPIAVPIL